MLETTIADCLYSPYLAAGVISSRECIRAALELVGARKVHANRDTGVGMWIQEIGEYLCGAFPGSLTHSLSMA